MSYPLKPALKWKYEKCMPDYSIIEPLCKELNITIPELIAGEESAHNSAYDERQTLEFLARIQNLEKQKKALVG